MKNLSPRVKDLLILAGVVILSAPISYCLLTLNGGEEVPTVVTYIWCIVLAYVCRISYLESRDKDPFVSGTTQRLGVVNSFTVSIFLFGINFQWFSGWLFSALIGCVCIFLSRELGRHSYKKREERYLNKSGILLGNLPNKAKAEINGKKVTVWSKDTIKSGTHIYISEIKGTYLYVSSISKREDSEKYHLDDDKE